MKTKLLFLIVFLFTSIFYAQTWEDINFIDSTDELAVKSIGDAVIDENDNLYIYGDDITSSTRFIKKINSSGEVEWIKDIGSYIDGYNTEGDVGAGLTGIAYSNNTLYVVGMENNSGIVIKTGISEDSPIEVFEHLSLQTTSSDLVYQNSAIVNDIKIVGNFIYIVGTFGYSQHDSSQYEFSNGISLVGNHNSSFIAKYTLSDGEMVWAKKIDATISVNTEAIDVDALGNIFISGNFKGTAVLYNGLNTSLFTNTNAASQAFLAKFSADGNFDEDFSFKTSNVRGGYDVTVCNINDAVYWPYYGHIAAYTKSGEGLLLWEKEVNEMTTLSIETNDCGDIYSGGYFNIPLNTGSHTGDNRENFIALSINKDTGETIWSKSPSQQSSIISYTSNVLISSDNRVMIIGKYFAQTGNDEIIIDQYTSNTSDGIFIGRYNDSALNNCCANAPGLSVNIPDKINICNENFQEICAPDPGTYTYEWSNSDNEILSTESCFTPVEYDLYTLQITNINGCVITLQDFDIVNAQGAADSIEDVFYCKKTPLVVGFSYPVTNAISYEWTFNGAPITAFNYAIPYQGAGEYCVTVNWTNIKLCATTICFEVIKCCKTNPDFTHTYNSPVNFMTIQNIPEYVDNYEEEKYLIYKQCNNTTNWVLEYTFIRSGDDMYDPIEIPVDSNCAYKIKHIVRSCNGKKMVNTHYVNEKNRVSVSPNPVKDTFEIVIDRFNLSDKMSIEIFDSVGLKLAHSNSITNRGFQINSRNWRPGIYFCKVRVNDNLYTSKIVKK
ncbi:MAG: T9SS type A sorting domain-containing protein [Winogradskyella sp.]|uniref:T9SS type A sorting domain-containing protein n=1 Tax=Winogradskyella sp. TaxID=1883156 RepID=UPI00385CFE12